MVIIDNVLGLEPGDEIGLFDANGLLNSGNCGAEYGELLVGAGRYDGGVTNILTVGSIDFCEYGGYQLSGWVPGNDIIVKVWDASEDFEYYALATFESNSQWGDLYSVITDLNAELIYSDISLDGVILNLSLIHI